MTSTLDDFAPRSARRKADRQAMALRLVDLAGEYQLAARHVPEEAGTRRTSVDIEGPHGLKLSVRFDGGSQDPDAYVLSWYGVQGARLAAGKFYSVNSCHGHKATDVAYGFAQLLVLLRRRFTSIRDDSAFEPDTRAAHTATVTPEDGGFLVACPAGCNLGTSAHAATGEAAARRVRLHRLATTPMGRRS